MDSRFSPIDDEKSMRLHWSRLMEILIQLGREGLARISPLTDNPTLEYLNLYIGIKVYILPFHYLSITLFIWHKIRIIYLRNLEFFNLPARA